jgi:iron complex transport system substrate-binding protein
LLPKTVEGKDYAQRFNDLGYDTLLLNLESLDDFFVNLMKLGEKLGRQERAENIIAKCKKMLNMVDERLKDIEERPTCYYASQRSLLNTSTGELLQSVMLETAGGKNVAKELSGGSVTITKEQLLLWNPEHIFISYNSNVTPESLADDPVYANLDAVKSGNVYKFPSDLSPWDYPSIEIFPAILWISTKIHPDAYEDVDFLEELNTFYEQIYGKSYTEFGGEL